MPAYPMTISRCSDAAAAPTTKWSHCRKTMSQDDQGTKTLRTNFFLSQH
jgi:hypothetical protein